jgi:hypothetical protein
MAFARHQFELSQPQDDGLALIEHLRSVERQTGKVHPLVANGPTMPRGCSQLWVDFLELHGSRGSTGFGAARITFTDLKAWQDVRGVRLDAWEIDAIRKVDSLWLSDYAPKPKEAK